jgi:protein-tyrosine phosphatase
MRWITLDGAVNVRDVGGLPTEDGSKTADNRLIRSDNLQDLSAADVAFLVNDVGLTRVVDLRTDMELDKEGPGPLTSVVEHAHFSLIRELNRGNDEETVKEALVADTERVVDQTGSDDDAVVANHYLSYLQKRPAEVVGAIRAITDTPGAALVHCAAGKDRTGVIVALTLLAVGVRRDAVVADYAATGDRIDSILARLRSSPTYTTTLDRLRPDQHKPRPAAMERFIEMVDSEFGGPVQWLADQGFGPDDVARLRAKLLEPND